MSRWDYLVATMIRLISSLAKSSNQAVRNLVSKMVLKVTAIEDIRANGFVSLLFHDSNQIHCRNTFAAEPPDAIARRKIAKGESIIFDTGRNTSDLFRPGTRVYANR